MLGGTTENGLLGIRQIGEFNRLWYGWSILDLSSLGAKYIPQSGRLLKNADREFLAIGCLLWFLVCRLLPFFL